MAEWVITNYLRPPGFEAVHYINFLTVFMLAWGEGATTYSSPGSGRTWAKCRSCLPGGVWVGARCCCCCPHLLLPLALPRTCGGWNGAVTVPTRPPPPPRWGRVVVWGCPRGPGQTGAAQWTSRSRPAGCRRTEGWRGWRQGWGNAPAELWEGRTRRVTQMTFRPTVKYGTPLNHGQFLGSQSKSTDAPGPPISSPPLSKCFHLTEQFSSE